MDPIHVLIILAVIGLLLWLVLTYIPMAPPFPRIITAVVVVITVLWLLQNFGLLDGFTTAHVSRYSR